MVENSKFIVENVIVSLIVHGMLYLNWNLRITIIALCIVHVFRENSNHQNNTFLSFSRWVWFISLVFTMTIFCVPPHCKEYETGTVTNDAFCSLLICIAIIGNLMSLKNSLVYGPLVLVITIVFLQYIYYGGENNIFCYNAFLMVFNDIAYWISISIFQFVYYREISHNDSDSKGYKRLQIISTFSILFSTSYICTAICICPSVFTYVYHSCKSTLTLNYSGDSSSSMFSVHSDDDDDDDDNDDDDNNNSILSHENKII